MDDILSKSSCDVDVTPDKVKISFPDGTIIERDVTQEVTEDEIDSIVMDEMSKKYGSSNEVPESPQGEVHNLSGTGDSKTETTG